MGYTGTTSRRANEPPRFRRDASDRRLYLPDRCASRRAALVRSSLVAIFGGYAANVDACYAPSRIDTAPLGNPNERKQGASDGINVDL